MNKLINKILISEFTYHLENVVLFLFSMFVVATVYYALTIIL